MRKEILIAISEILIEQAQKHSLITYGQLSKIPDGAIPPLALNKPLGTISKICIENNMPPLSAIVVNQDTLIPGEGFFGFVGGLLGHVNLDKKLDQWEAFFNHSLSIH